MTFMRPRLLAPGGGQEGVEVFHQHQVSGKGPAVQFGEAQADVLVDNIPATRLAPDKPTLEKLPHLAAAGLPRNSRGVAQRKGIAGLQGLPVRRDGLVDILEGLPLSPFAVIVADVVIAISPRMMGITMSP